MKVDVAIVGGGLAGLSLAICLRRKGLEVALFEKKIYPFHKVCGEYISNEALVFLDWLGFPVQEVRYPKLNQFRITHSAGLEFKAPLPLGGIGISRHRLENWLQLKAKSEGVHVLDGIKVNSFEWNGQQARLTNNGPDEEITACIAVCATGRNIPHFLAGNSNSNKSGYIGVKRHLSADIPTDQIELHHFPGGYCGISAVENNAYCFCYLVQEEQVKACKGNLDALESALLKQNKNLRHYLETFEPLTERVATAGVDFGPRNLYQPGILFTGDSAGMIPPLAGNGMSMALHSAVLASEVLADMFFQGKSADEAGHRYANQWNKEFYWRLSAARLLQKTMDSSRSTSLSLRLFRTFPSLFQWSVRQTHGKSIPLPSNV